MRIHPIILVSLFLSTCLCWEPIISTPYEFQGAQIVESTFAYANNLRYSPSTGRLYFKADKSMPNIFYMTSKGDDAKSFNVVQGSPLNASNAYPFLTFDVVNSQNTDYIIGTTYGSWFSNGFGLNIQASAADKTLSSNISTPSCYLYSFVVDNSSQSVDYRYNFYAVGYCYTPTNHATNGIILTKGQVQLLQNLPITWTITDSVESIEEGCYDVWTETLKPRMRLSREGQDQFIYVSIPGRCNSIYKYQLNSDAKFHPALVKVYKPLDSTINIVSTTFSGNQKIYFATKKFNSEESYINVLSTVDMVVKKTVKLEAQESTPILALDHHTDTLYIATAGFNKIFKYNADLVKQGIAVLPEQLKQTSSMVYHTGFLYMVTSEPNANIGRISEKNFCNDFCGVYGYCNKGTCACITDYEKSPRTGECAPYFVVRNEVEIISAQTAAAAFGVLFAFAVIAAVAGWFLWFRRQSTFNKF